MYNIVKECYPNEALIEEEPIRTGGKTLYIDIYVPRLKIAIECDGEQHFSYNKFFHGSQASFVLQRINDKAKTEYCEDNNITLVRVKYNDKLSKDFILNKIIEALTGDN